MGAQPARHLVGAAGGDGVEAASGDATEVVVDGGRGGRTNDAEIDGLRLTFSSFKGTPGAQRFPVRAQVQGASKIIAAARWYDKHGKLEAHQRREMAVNGAVAAEDCDRIGIARGGGKALDPGGWGIALEGFEF